MIENNTFCMTVVSSLLSHLQAEFETHSENGGCVVVTPFPHSDLASIEFYVEATDQGYLLSDEGETLNILFVNGLTIEDNNELLEQVRQIALANNVGFEDSTLFTQATTDELGSASQRLLNSIQAVSYLIYKRSHRKRTTFNDEVEELLLEHSITYIPGYTVRGKANTHRIAFHVNSNRNLLLEPISATTIPSARNKAKAIAYKWVDLREAKAPFRFVVVVDDKENRWEKVWSDEEARNALTTYSDSVIRWTTQQPSLVGLLTQEP